jgi:hypothetical protein
MGYIYLKNPLATLDYDQETNHYDDICHALGLRIEVITRDTHESIAEITQITRGSLADIYGQLRVGMLKMNKQLLNMKRDNIGLVQAIKSWNGTEKILLKVRSMIFIEVYRVHHEKHNTYK